MVHKNVLPQPSYQLLEEIQRIEAFNEFYLAGGTSLALQLGHRISIDLDFFNPKEFTTSLLSKFPNDYQAANIHDNSIEIFSRDTKVFFFYFAFPLKNEIKSEGSLRLADPVDIGLMKLLALQGRSTRKDIIDLYFIDKEVMELEDLLILFEQHYPSESFNSYSSLKKLMNFEQIEAEPMPKMLKDFSWDDAKELVNAKVTKHIATLLQKTN